MSDFPALKEEFLLPVLRKVGYESYEVREEFISKRNKVFLLKVVRAPQQKIEDKAAEQVFDELSAMGLFAAPISCGGDCSGCSSDCADRQAPSNATEELAVWKQYEQGDTMYELAMLKLLHNNGLHTPIVFAASDHGILEQYIEGVNLVDLFAEAERDRDYAEEIILALVRWFKDYYAITAGKSRGDINLRNFIFNASENALYGIDFEDTHFCSPVYDIGDLLAYLINYEPAFSDWKCEWLKRIASAFILELRLSASELKARYKEALKDLELRRFVVVPQNIFELLDEI